MPIGRPRWFFQIDGGFFAVVDGGFFRAWAARLHFGKIPKKIGQIWRKFSKILAKFAKFWKKTAKKSAIFNANFEIRERLRRMSPCSRPLRATSAFGAPSGAFAHLARRGRRLKTSFVCRFLPNFSFAVTLWQNFHDLHRFT